MSLNSQSVLRGHIPVDQLCQRIRLAYRCDVSARQATSKDYWVIEFADDRDALHHLDVFLNSYAADDYQELGVKESTLLVTPYSATSETLLRAAADGSVGWIRPLEQGEWVSLKDSDAKRLNAVIAR